MLLQDGNAKGIHKKHDNVLTVVFEQLISHIKRRSTELSPKMLQYRIAQVDQAIIVIRSKVVHNIRPSKFISNIIINV